MRVWPFQTPSTRRCAVAQRDELLEQLRARVLDVVEVEHHVVAHLEGEVDLLDLLARGRVGRLGGIERRDLVAERRTVHLHEDEPELARDVLHQRGLAVAGRRDEQQHAHEVGALLRADRADLLGEVRADERQVDLVDELVAHERREHARRELAHAQAAPLALDDLRLELAERAEARRRARSTNGTRRPSSSSMREPHACGSGCAGASRAGPSTVVSTVAALRLALDAAIGDEHHRGLAHERPGVLELLRCRRTRRRTRARRRGARGDVLLERAQLVLERAAARRSRRGTSMSPRHRLSAARAGDEARTLLGGELLDEVARRRLRDRRAAAASPSAFARAAIGASSSAASAACAAGVRGLGAEPPEAARARVRATFRAVGVERRPVERRRARARRARSASSPAAPRSASELLEDHRGVGVVDAALVALVEAVLARTRAPARASLLPVAARASRRAPRWSGPLLPSSASKSMHAARNSPR